MSKLLKKYYCRENWAFGKFFDFCFESGAASYRLTYQTSEDGTPTTINTASRRQEVAGLLSGTAYEFVVTTIGEEGTLSEPSQAATRTTRK